MANMYTQFSFELKWPETARAAAVEQLRSDAAIDSGAACECANDGATLTLYCEENCSIEEKVALLAKIQKQFKLPPFGFEFALTCSKPVVNEFGGGAVVVVKGRPTYLSTAAWLQREFKRRSHQTH